MSVSRTTARLIAAFVASGALVGAAAMPAMAADHDRDRYGHSHRWEGDWGRWHHGWYDNRHWGHHNWYNHRPWEREHGRYHGWYNHRNWDRDHYHYLGR